MMTIDDDGEGGGGGLAAADTSPASAYAARVFADRRRVLAAASACVQVVQIEDAAPLARSIAPTIKKCVSLECVMIGAGERFVCWRL